MIAKHTEEDPILSQLLDIVKSGKKLIPKSASNKLQKFEPILDEITISGNNILLKSDKIILNYARKTLELAQKEVTLVLAAWKDVFEHSFSSITGNLK